MTRQQKRTKRNETEHAFVRTVKTFYKTHGRHDLPWRHTTDPYKILVSETMLQQTQVPRVIGKYREFLKTFPTVQGLARAPLGDVLRVWQGLGYNRRAKLLWLGAQEIVGTYHGTYPCTYHELLQLPGIGPYTAAAVMAFAYNEPGIMIETNVRTVYLHHFFPSRSSVTDAELLPYIERTLDRRNPREWYAALMDYGTHLKHTVGNANTRSRHYKRQSSFNGSTRQVRGALLRLLAEEKATSGSIKKRLPEFASDRLDVQLAALHAEGLIAKTNRTYHLP